MELFYFRLILLNLFDKYYLDYVIYRIYTITQWVFIVAFEILCDKFLLSNFGPFVCLLTRKPDRLPSLMTNGLYGF